MNTLLPVIFVLVTLNVSYTIQILILQKASSNSMFFNLCKQLYTEHNQQDIYNGA